MDHPQMLNSRPWQRRFNTAVILAAILGLAVPPGHAGIRDLAKSAKDKAAKVAGQKGSADAKNSGSSGQDIAFDDTMLELTGDLLDKLLACRKTAMSTLHDRDALIARRNALMAEIDALSSKNGNAIAENDNKRAEVNQCMTSALEGIRQKKLQADMAQQMANPRSAEKTMKYTAAIGDAQMKGDTAAVNRLTREMLAPYEANHADSLAAEKECGRMPAVHPAKARIDALNRELAEVNDKIRELDAKAMKLQADQCKMTEGQVAMAWERITLYLERSKPGENPNGFSAVELKALAERRDALSAAMKG